MIAPEFLLPQDKVMVRDKETGDVSIWHATDAKHALTVEPTRYELVQPVLPPRDDSRPHPMDANYAAAAARPPADWSPAPPPNPPPAPPMAATAEDRGDKARGYNPADDPHTLEERADELKGPLSN